MPVRRSERRADLVSRTRPVRLRRRAPFSSLHRPRDRTRAREARDRGASPREGTTFSSRGEITIMQRFERCVVGGSPAARSIFSAWPRSSGLRLLSGSTQVQILPRGLFGGETGRGAGTRLKRIGRLRAAGEHDLSPPPYFRRVKPRSAVIGWKPFRAARPVGQDHCSPPLWRVNPPRCGRCFENRWIGSSG
jgi:hypothetical protein